jgi:hypothetical protein
MSLPRTAWNKKYFTKEEKLIAKAVKNARYYWKHKESYNCKMNEHYHSRYKHTLILKRYGLSEDDYNTRLSEQNNVCAICQRPASVEGRRLSVDHDHKCCSGKDSCGKCVRGLLCSACNTVLGMMKDDSTVLVRAATYLMSRGVPCSQSS